MHAPLAGSAVCDHSIVGCKGLHWILRPNPLPDHPQIFRNRHVQRHRHVRDLTGNKTVSSSETRYQKGASTRRHREPYASKSRLSAVGPLARIVLKASFPRTYTHRERHSGCTSWCHPSRNLGPCYSFLFLPLRGRATSHQQQC